MKFDTEKLAAIEHVGSPLLVTANTAKTGITSAQSSFC